MRFGLSRTTKIVTLLIIDVCFFFIELIAGYAVGSLALVADSFHMLNDVMSLIVALYAIKLSRSSASSRYSYGWHRAEILAALVNGVFLLALCFSIFMEAIEKFINTPEVSSPRLVVIVGSLGLISNIVGLFLFHDHDHAHEHQSHGSTKSQTETTPLLFSESGRSQTRPDSPTSVYGHPVQNRAYLMQTAYDTQEQSEAECTPIQPSDIHFAANSDLRASGAETLVDVEAGNASHAFVNAKLDRGADHPSSKSSHRQGHASGSMNMRALVLHVLGDALGNVGVIATGLIIWLSDWSFKYYCDPLISLFITVIIFSSAMPLVRSASFILLQGVPSNVSLDQVRCAIRRVSGVVSIHELHVWQLSESKIVASVHVWVSAKEDFMTVASSIREILHDHGVHSSTIQPEFYTTEDDVPEEQIASVTDCRCLLACPPGPNCNDENVCCPPGQTPNDFLPTPSSTSQ